MNNYYSLQIDSTDSNIDEVVKILNIKINNDFIWEYEFENYKEYFTFKVVNKEGEKDFDFINYFLDILENKYSDLQKIGIEKSDITIWKLYEYNEQCNIEFHPEETKRLGDNGIVLCVSCWTNN